MRVLALVVSSFVGRLAERSALGWGMCVCVSRGGGRLGLSLGGDRGESVKAGPGGRVGCTDQAVFSLADCTSVLRTLYNTVQYLIV